MNCVKIWSFELLISDRMTLLDHMQIFLGNGNSPRLRLDAYRAPLIPIAPGFSWQCDLGQMKIFRTMLCTLCQNCLLYILYSICILVIFPLNFLSIIVTTVCSTVSSCGQQVPNEFHTLIFCIIVTRNGLNTKRSLQSRLNFHVSGSIINFPLTGNDMCHSQPKP